MSYKTYAAPKSISRRGFLAGSAAVVGAAMSLPGTALGQAEGQLLLWLPGGSDLFCKIHTGLLDGFSTKASLGPATTVCGLGQDTEFTQALIGSITAGSPPDISMLWDSPVSLGAQGAFMALDDMMKGSKIDISTWPKGLLSSCQFKGATYGLPVTAGVYSMWYNEELFDAKGIPSDRASFPKTWAEMRKLSKEFTVWDGDDLKSAGFMPNRIPETMAIWSALNGGMLFDEANLKYMLDSEQNVEMMSFFLEWLDEEYKGDVNLIDRSGSFKEAYPDGETGAGPAFREGRQAGLMSGSWLMGDIYADPVPTFTRWNQAPNPVGPSGSASVSGTWPNWFVIPIGSKNPQAAFDYLTYLAIEGSVEWYQQIPDVPTNSQVAVKPPNSLIEHRGQAFAEDLTAFIATQAAIVTPMWNSPVQSFGNDQMARAMEKIYTHAQPVAEALAEAQAAAQAELERVLAG